MTTSRRSLLTIIVGLFIIFIVTYLILSIIIINQSDNVVAIIRNQNKNKNVVSIMSTQSTLNDMNLFRNINNEISKQIDKENVTINDEDNREQQHLFDYINSPKTLNPFNFNKCQMSNCFDHSRCLKDNSSLKVYIVPAFERDYFSENINQSSTTLGESNIIHQNILKIIKESKYYEADPEKACLFVLEDDTLDRDPLSPSFRPNLPTSLFGSDNFYGMNHLVFNLYSGTWPDYKENDFAGLQFGAAIIAKASNSKQFHRPNFDISLPLFSYQHPYDDNYYHNSVDHDQKDINNFGNHLLEDTSINQSFTKNQSRSFFLTFKGKRYVIGSGSKTRNSLYHINNDRDVIMLTTCRHGKRWRESSDIRCSEDESNYDKYDFVDLMKESTFCLVPRGRRLGSFRFLEALSYSCIPVIMSDGWVNPFDEIIDWSTAMIQFDEDLLLIAPDMLRDIDKKSIDEMQSNCSILYKTYFSSTKKIILSVLSIIEQRILKNKK